MGQKVSINIVKTESKVKPKFGDNGSVISFGKEDEEDEDEEDDEEEEEDEENKCPCECCTKKCPCCVKLTFCCLSAFA